MNNTRVLPIVKWVGGKRQLLGNIIEKLPAEVLEDRTAYFEPFIGGGAVLFRLQMSNAVINDHNEELINLYRVIRDRPAELIEDLKRHRNEKDYFYAIRAVDRDPDLYLKLTDIERASRIIYLNKTCYNGLFRVNRRGQFNTPFGRYLNPNIVNEDRIRAVSTYLSSSGITILNTDFEDAVVGIKPGSFVYFDPPYDPVSESANFTSYAKTGFGREEQMRLHRLCCKLDESGVKFLLSNSATEFIRDLYSDFHVEIVRAGRAVNSNAAGRGAVDEVLVSNYQTSQSSRLG